MKRSPMPRRRSPLRSSSTLRRTPLARESAKRKRDNAQRTVVVSAMRAAAAGTCARCGRVDWPVYGHERLARAQGGSMLAPDCLLCNVCNTWCEDAPREAAWTGWKLSSKWPHDPALSPTQARDIYGNVVEFEIPEDVAS